MVHFEQTHPKGGIIPKFMKGGLLWEDCSKVRLCPSKNPFRSSLEYIPPWNFSSFTFIFLSFRWFNFYYSIYQLFPIQAWGLIVCFQFDFFKRKIYMVECENVKLFFLKKSVTFLNFNIFTIFWTLLQLNYFCTFEKHSKLFFQVFEVLFFVYIFEQYEISWI